MCDCHSVNRDAIYKREDKYLYDNMNNINYLRSKKAPDKEIETKLSL